MMLLLRSVLASALGRWVLGGVVALLLGGAAFMWHNHKSGLREEGRQECVQEINQATVDSLLRELAYQDEQIARLKDEAAVTARAVNIANQRRRAAEDNLELIRREMERQRNEDPQYKDWADAPLPDGVADRLRQAAGESASDDADGR